MGKVGGMQWTEFNHSFQKALLFFQICTSCWHVLRERFSSIERAILQEIHAFRHPDRYRSNTTKKQIKKKIWSWKFLKLLELRLRSPFYFKSQTYSVLSCWLQCTHIHNCIIKYSSMLKSFLCFYLFVGSICFVLCRNRKLLNVNTDPKLCLIISSKSKQL